MAKSDEEDLAAQAAKRAGFRLHHVGTKLNAGELLKLEELLAKRDQTQGEFIHGLILSEIERDRQGVRPSAELVEIAALRLQMMNLLKPVLAGKPMTPETFDAIMRETKSHISNDLAGAISQALKYRSSLIENIRNLQGEQPTLIASEPYCVVVASDCIELNSSEKKASFERFREQLNGVQNVDL
jgi:hypothetical protein